MKKQILFLLLLIITTAKANTPFSQRNEKFKLFGVKIKAKDITGNNNFNDLGLPLYTDVINRLTTDTLPYLYEQHIGTIRRNYRDYTQGDISLFNLSYYTDDKGYPILDSIDFSYYKKVGFNILEHRHPNLTKESGYSTFKEELTNESKPLAERRQILWKDSNKSFRDSLLATRFFENNQLVSDKVIKKVQNKFFADLSFDFASILKSAGINNPKVKLNTYLNHLVTKSINLRGNYISLIFQPQYIDLANDIISEYDSATVASYKDKFSIVLLKYIPSKDNALNSAVFMFKLKGEISNINIDSTLFETYAGAKINANNFMSVSVQINDEFQKSVRQILTNDFNKLWVIKFGTDIIFDSLKLKELPNPEKCICCKHKCTCCKHKTYQKDKVDSKEQVDENRDNSKKEKKLPTQSVGQQEQKYWKHKR